MEKAMLRKTGREGRIGIAVRLSFEEETPHAEVGTDCFPLVNREQHCREWAQQVFLDVAPRIPSYEFTHRIQQSKDQAVVKLLWISSQITWTCGSLGLTN